MADRKYEYNGLDIINDIKKETYSLVFAIGNHEYSDYEGLKLLIETIISIEKDKIPLIIDSLIDLELSIMEKNNAIASLGYNKRVHDFFSYICALNDLGYTFNSERFSSKMFKVRGNLIIKNNYKLDIMIDNPIRFSYDKSDDSVSSNKKLKSNEKINGLELCNLMFYIGSNKYKNSSDVLKHGNFVKNKEIVKVLK